MGNLGSLLIAVFFICFSGTGFVGDVPVSGITPTMWELSLLGVAPPGHAVVATAVESIGWF